MYRRSLRKAFFSLGDKTKHQQKTRESESEAKEVAFLSLALKEALYINYYVRPMFSLFHSVQC